MLPQFGDYVRQEMYSGGAVLRLRVDDFSVPHRANDVQLLPVEVDIFPLQAAKFCEREASPSGNHNRASRQAIHRVRDLLDLDRKSTRLNSSHGYISYA